ncbi:MAG: hypothetical protein A4E58_02178 [Syntrophorhabdus sp. PtaB.Bin006]|nr:MAG: hypothetical protein A4E58_02178 [Syntrophorhabdus sp. PtaB.Bin006]
MLMSNIPQFPAFKPIELEDRDVFRNFFRTYKAVTSELTFTNLFIWRFHYSFQWTLHKDWIIILCTEGENGVCALEPVGPSSRAEVTRMLLEWMGDEKGERNPRIERADERLAGEVEGIEGISVEPARDHFDYVYLRDELIRLAGSKYRSKRNHINQLLRGYSFRYAPLDSEHVGDCLELQEKWCRLRRCEDDLNLLGEWEAVREILMSYENLDVQGGVVTIENKVMAFTIGEMLNDETVVVHIEKADPDIPGLYPVINQQFCENNWQDARYINREQDLGVPGMREAKLSYYPDHLVKKYRITLAGK